MSPEELSIHRGNGNKVVVVVVVAAASLVGLCIACPSLAKHLAPLIEMALDGIVADHLV